MSAAEHVALVHRYFDALNRADAAALAALVAPEWQQHLAGQTTLMNPTQMITTLHANFADLHYAVLDAFSDGSERVTARWTYSGTPLVPLRLGERTIPPTGRAIAGHALGIFRLADDRIAESWIANDMPRVLADVESANTEANKAVVRRLIEDVWNRANPDAIDELIAPDRLFAGRPAPPQVVRTNNARVVAARPDQHTTINDLVAEGDKVVVWWTGRGTHLGEYEHPVFGRVEPTGKQLTTNGLAIHRVAGGKLVELLVLIEDELSLGQQLGAIPTPDQSPAVLEANKAVVRRIVEEVWNRTNLDAADELFAPDFHRAGQVLGPSGVKAHLARLSANQPDLHYTIEDLVADGDRVVIRTTTRGTIADGVVMQTPLFGRMTPPAGTKIAVSGVNIFRLADGKVAETWEYADLVSWGQQLGAIPTPSQTPA